MVETNDSNFNNETFNNTSNKSIKDSAIVIEKFLNSSKTLDSLFRLSSQYYGQRNFIGIIVKKNDSNGSSERHIQYLTYQQVFNRSLAIASWIIETKKIPNKQSTRVAFIVENGPITRIFYQAIALTKFVALPLYRAVGEKSIVEMIRKAKCNIAICDDFNKLKILIDNSNILIHLKLIIIIEFSLKDTKINDDEFLDKIESLKNNQGLQIEEYSNSNQDINDFETKYHHDDHPYNIYNFEKPIPSDHAIIFCTSGSTGIPKLAVHTHESLHCTISDTVRRLYPAFYDIKPHMIRTYQLLPEQHILASNAVNSMLSIGGAIVYPSGKNPKEIRESMCQELQLVKPVFLVVVPLLLTRIQKSIENELKSANGLMGTIRSKIFNLTYSITNSLGNNSMKSLNSGFFNNYIANLVFRRIKDNLGGNLRFFVCAGAFLDQNVMQFIETTTQAKILQGYGLSECLGTLVKPFDRSYHCGKELDGVQMLLKSVPQMGYFVKEKKGEICLKGQELFCGYLNEKGDLDPSLNSEGYFETGDIGHIDTDGFLRIIDRKKNIFKLSHGEFVSLSYIQDIYLLHPIIKDVFVYGRFTKSYLVGIIFLDQESFNNWIVSQKSSSKISNNNSYNLNNSIDPNIYSLSVHDAIKNQTIIDHITNDILEFSIKKGLSSIQRVTKWSFKTNIIPSIENGLLTVTMKQKRKNFEQTFHDDLNKLYMDL